MEEVIILTDFPLKKGCNVTIVILQNDKHLLTINKSNNNYTATWQKWKWAAMMWCLRSVRKTRSEENVTQQGDFVFLNTGFRLMIE